MGRRKARKNRIIVLEEVNHFWDRPELDELVRMWNEGVPVQAMGEHFKRDPDEVLLALIHLAKEDEIMTRTGGGLGWI